MSDKFEIVDGQQRLLALAAFRKGSFALFEVNDPKFKIPQSLRSLPAPWAGKTYAGVGSELKTVFDEFKIDVQQIDDVSTPDEIRDLFIRLQSGTALTPQQVRDAWPGNVGPFIEMLAGKMEKKPALQLFELIDRRGGKNEDDDQKDQFVDHRSTAAQFLRTFMARASDPLNFVNLSTKHLDALYHENPGFDPNGPLAKLFQEVLGDAQKILKFAIDFSTASATTAKKKFRKIDVLCLVAHLQDVRSNPLIKIDTAAQKVLGSFLATYEGAPGGKNPTGTSLLEAYKKFQSSLPDGVSIRLDPNRAFSADQRLQIKLLQDGLCSICNKPVPDDEIEIDHYPVSYARGGPTDVSNGRLVHERCHPRHGALPK